MPDCPICATPAHQRFGGAPYRTCPNCDAWFQSPQAPKLYEAAREKDSTGGHGRAHRADHVACCKRLLVRETRACASQGSGTDARQQSVP
jgi:hypothetical protein